MPTTTSERFAKNEGQYQEVAVELAFRFVADSTAVIWNLVKPTLGASAAFA